MFDSRTIDDLAARLGRAFEASPAKDVEKNVKALLKSGLSRLDLVTLEEFDLQVDVLKRTREKIETLEARVAALEARAVPEAPPKPNG